MKKRLFFFSAFLLIFAAEIIIALFVHDSIIRPYFGDVLIVILIYCLIRTVFPDKITLLPLYIFLFSATVEVLQYFNFVSLMGLGNNAFARLFFGTTFSMIDILCYLIGSLFCALYEFLRKKSPPSVPHCKNSYKQNDHQGG